MQEVIAKITESQFLIFFALKIIVLTDIPRGKRYFVEITNKKRLKIPKGQSESVYRRRTENTMAKRKSTKGQTTINKTYIQRSSNTNPTKNRE